MSDIPQVQDTPNTGIQTSSDKDNENKESESIEPTSTVPILPSHGNVVVIPEESTTPELTKEL